MQLTVDAASVRPYALPMTPPIVVGQQAMVRRHGLIVALRFGEHVGQGDVAPWPGFADTPQDGLPDGPKLAAMAHKLDAALRQHVVGRVVRGAGEPGHGPQDWAACLLQEFAALAQEVPTAFAGALACAFLDALGQRAGLPMAHLLGPTPAQSVAVHKLVDTAWAAQNACKQGYVALKIKVGRKLLSDELATLCAIRSCVGPKIALRLDANGAWPQAIAVQALRLFAAVSPSWSEQPVRDVAGHKALKDLKIMPIAADESIKDEEALCALLEADAVDGVVLKPSFVGGPHKAVLLGQRAQAGGKRVCVTHAFDSAVGQAVALQVALALGTAEPCGLGPLGPMALAPRGAGLGLSEPVLAVAPAP